MRKYTEKQAWFIGSHQGNRQPHPIQPGRDKEWGSQHYQRLCPRNARRAEKKNSLLPHRNREVRHAQLAVSY